VDRFRNENNCRAINWGVVLGAGGKVYPGDLDGILERNGRFLAIEWKHESVTYETIPQGQRILLERLNNIPEFTVAVVYGDYETWAVSGIQWIGGKRVPFDNDSLKEWMREWWRYANKNPAGR